MKLRCIEFDLFFRIALSRILIVSVYSEVDFPNFDLFNFLVKLFIAIIEAIRSILISHNDGLIVFKEIDSKFTSAKDRTKNLLVINCLGRRDNTKWRLVCIGIIFVKSSLGVWLVRAFKVAVPRGGRKAHQCDIRIEKWHEGQSCSLVITETMESRGLEAVSRAPVK